METKMLSKDELEKVVKLIQQDNVVAIPTDTVFGLAIRYDSIDAIKKLKQAKSRDEGKPFPMMVDSLEGLEKVAYVNSKYYNIIKTYMPGPLTIIVKKKTTVPDFATNGKDTIAIRMPNDEFMLQVIRSCKMPLLVTSANLANCENTSNDSEVKKQLDGRISAIVRGESNSKIASTIIDLTSDEIKILRQGAITLEQIERCL